MIYCVEDDEAAGNLEAYALETSGYGVELFSDGKFSSSKTSRPPSMLAMNGRIGGTSSCRRSTTRWCRSMRNS